MIGFAGLSHLGIVSSIATASKGWDVVAYDPDASLCEGLAEGRLPLSEPGLGELLAANRSRLRFSADPADLGGCQVLYFSSDVPTDEDGLSDLSPLRRLIGDGLAHASRIDYLAFVTKADRLIFGELHEFRLSLELPADKGGIGVPNKTIPGLQKGQCGCGRLAVQ